MHLRMPAYGYITKSLIHKRMVKVKQLETANQLGIQCMSILLCLGCSYIFRLQLVSIEFSLHANVHGVGLVGACAHASSLYNGIEQPLCMDPMQLAKHC